MDSMLLNRAVLVYAACLIIVPLARGEDWPSFLGSNRDGKSGVRQIRTDWNAGKLPILWTRKVGEAYTGGSVAGGRYYLFDRLDNETRLASLDAKTGKQIWLFKYSTSYRDYFGYDGGPRSTPVVDGDRVYIYGVEGWLHCLDTQDGSVKWKTDTMKSFGVVPNFFGVGSTPLIYRDKLIVMIGGSPESAREVSPGSLNLVRANGTAIVAFDKMTGKVVFQAGDDLASYSSPVVRTIDGRDWCLAYCRRQLLGLDPRTGKVAFAFPWRAKKLYSVNASTPVVMGHRIFISESYQRGAVMLQLEGDRPEVVWQDQRRIQSIAAHWNTPIEVDGYVYGCHGEHRGSAELRCIDAATGKVRWSRAGLQRTSLTYADGHFVCLSEIGRLMLIKVNPDRFELVSEFKPTADQLTRGARLDYPCWAAPVIANGLMYVRGKERLICFCLSRSS